MRKRVLVVAGAYLGSLVLIALAAFFLVILLAGPHGGLLPRALAPLVIGAGWLCVLLLPAWIAYVVWRRGG